MNSFSLHDFRLYGEQFLLLYIIVFLIIPRLIYNLNKDHTYSTSLTHCLNMRVYKIKLLQVNECFFHFLLQCRDAVQFLTKNSNYLKKLTVMKAKLEFLFIIISLKLLWGTVRILTSTRLAQGFPAARYCECLTLLTLQGLWSPEVKR